MNSKQFSDILKFWRDVEIITPNTAPKVSQHRGQNTREEQLVSEWSRHKPAPWHIAPPPFTKWQHTMCGCIFTHTRFIDLLRAHIPQQSAQVTRQFIEPSTACGFVFSISLTDEGEPDPDTFMLSMGAWILGEILRHPVEHTLKGLTSQPSAMQFTSSGLPEFDKRVEALREQLKSTLAINKSAISNDDLLADFSDVVASECNLWPLYENGHAGWKHRIRSIKIKNHGTTSVATTKLSKATIELEPKHPVDINSDELINSLFIKDINRVLSAGPPHPSSALGQYLSPLHDAIKIDVREDQASAIELLDPSKFPQGCWPSEHPLVWSQQLAVNSMWAQLRNSSGLFGVNGPPGTGKTTLLRDVVATIIVERAKELASKGNKLFTKEASTQTGSKTISYFDLDPTLFGYSIVVASSNNGAVENVSLELPKLESIDNMWRPTDEQTHFSKIATNISGAPSWGLVAACLGKKANRSRFNSKFWFADRVDDKPTSLKDLLLDLQIGKIAPTIPWDVAVREFQQAIRLEEGTRAEVKRYATLPGQIRKIEADLQRALDSVDNKNREIESSEKERNSISAQTHSLTKTWTKLQTDYAQHIAIKPNFLDWLSTFGRSHRIWNERLESLTQLRNETDKKLKINRDKLASITLLLNENQKLKSSHQEDAKTISAQLRTKQSLLENAKREIGANWPSLDMDAPSRERSSPWHLLRWRLARIDLFMKAMNLHQAFIECNAQQMKSNLSLAVDMLKGQVGDYNARRIALTSLSIACPVISTTFASASSMFGDLAENSIGWLLIDEAGQATPQAAVGAIWRSKRVVSVGDPLQLTPVVTIPRELEVGLANANRAIPTRLQPSRTSVQAMADLASTIGTYVGRHPNPLWVGSPLIVHRRCDDPMFSIANAIAYDGMMVHHKNKKESDLPPSHWVHVPNCAPNQAQENWLPDEGVALDRLLNFLLTNHPESKADIYLISPFASVASKLKSTARRFDLNTARAGTIHTTQGKEADIVILVLGGKSHGAKDWAASTPNLLNVAISRAKMRTYVVGDRHEWSSRQYFCTLSQLLPALDSNNGHVSL